jgi:hypothetical protein
MKIRSGLIVAAALLSAAPVSGFATDVGVAQGLGPRAAPPHFVGWHAKQ